MNLRRALLIFLLYAASCTSIEVKDYTPKKHPDIPDSAFWRGGIDGGNWFTIRGINNHRNVVNISIYNDQSGSLITAKRFIVVCRGDKPAFIEDLQQQINFFDGEKIYLKQTDTTDCYLRPLQ